MKTKNLLLASMSLLLLSGCVSNAEPEKNFVMSKSYVYQRSGRHGEWDLSRHYEYKYDEKGRRTEEKTFAHVGEEPIIEELVTSTYDNAGNETSYDSIMYDADGSIHYRSGFTYENYDAFGNCGKETRLSYETPYEEPCETSVIICEFDSKGKKTKETTEYEVINYEYYSNGLVKTKTFSDIDGQNTLITHKIEYVYTDDNQYKDIFIYGYSDGAFEESPYSTDHYEYNEDGFMTLYATYSGNEIEASTEREIISDTTYKETIKMITPDAGFAVAYVTEVTYSCHEGMLNEDINCLLFELEKSYDAYISTVYPTYEEIRSYTHKNGNIKEYLHETVYYQSNSDVETSYFATKEVCEYIEL